MRKLSVATLLLVACVVVLAADPSPEPAKGGDRWEYAELQTSASLARAMNALGKVAGPGGVPVPGGVAAKAALRTSVKWATGDDEIDANDWADLATKLKMPAAKDGKPATKLRVLNHLGSEGWELVSSTTALMTFKRKVRK
jgi:hypothetical protein